MRPTNLLPLALLFLALVAGASRASADPGAVVVTGKASQRDRAVVASAVRSAARSVGWSLLETPLSDADSTKLVACMKEPKPWDCIAKVAGAKDLRRLIVVSLDPERAPDGKPALALSQQVLLPDSPATTSDTRYCPQCVDELLTRVAFDLTKRLIEEAATGTARTNLVIESEPTGAWITLDGTNVGLTNRKYPTFPGRHVVILQREGYESETRTVDALENQDTPVRAVLRPKGGKVIDGGDRPAWRRYLVPGVVGGAGLAAGVIGGVLQATKDPPPLGEHQPARLYSGPGIGLMIGGGLAVGAGVYLWYRARKAPGQPPKATPKSKSAPTAALTSTGAFIGWTGSF
jgi:hypothetical protein